MVFKSIYGIIHYRFSFLLIEKYKTMECLIDTPPSLNRDDQMKKGLIVLTSIILAIIIMVVGIKVFTPKRISILLYRNIEYHYEEKSNRTEYSTCTSFFLTSFEVLPSSVSLAFFK